MDTASALSNYRHRLPPFPQQAEALRLSVGKRRFALLMEQGTGKTKVIIDTAAIHFYLGTINGLLAIAPNDVHEQWVVEQIPEHMPSDIRVRARVWQASRAKAVRECKELIAKPLPDTLAVLAMNHEAFATKRGCAIARRFLNTYRTLIALDESDLAITTPSASRTRALVYRIGPYAVMRRIMTGTPAEDPFDLYSQFNFLDMRILNPDADKIKPSFLAFKHRYAKWTKNMITSKNPNPKTGKRYLQEYETLECYQNLDDLYTRIAPYTYRIRKAQCMNLPPKLYSKRLVSLSRAQLEVYEELRDNGLVMLRKAEQAKTKSREPVDVMKLSELTEEELLLRSMDKDMRTTAAIKLTLLLRLQQCVGGFVTDDNHITRPIDGDQPNPRMKALQTIVHGALQGPAKVVVWAVFRAELAMLTKLLPNFTAIYGGTHSKSERSSVIASFKDPTSKLRGLIAHPMSLGVGMNFAVAQTEAFYSCGASARQRMQAEDRCHRIGTVGTVNIYDFDAHEVPIDKKFADFRAGKAEFNKIIMSWTADQLQEII